MREKYESLSLSVLRSLAKTRGMKGISTLKKGELIEAMLALDEKEKEENSVEPAAETSSVKHSTGQQESVHTERGPYVRSQMQGSRQRIRENHGVQQRTYQNSQEGGQQRTYQNGQEGSQQRTYQSGQEGSSQRMYQNSQEGSAAYIPERTGRQFAAHVSEQPGRQFAAYIPEQSGRQFAAHVSERSGRRPELQFRYTI